MKQFMTAREIAEAQLPGLPAKENGLARMAKRENWPSQPRLGRGGGREYNIAYLPQAALSELALRNMSKRAKKQKKSKAPLDAYNQPKSSARACILQLLNKFMSNSGLRAGAAAQMFAKHYNAGDLEVRAWILEHFDTVNPRTLRRWRTQVKQKGVKGLEGGKKGPRGSSMWHKNENLRQYIIAQIDARPHISARAIYKGYKANFKDAPTLRSMQTYVANYRRDNEYALLHAENPDKFRSHRQVAFGSLSAGIDRLNQKWEIDGTIADVQVLDGKKLVRYSLVALIDVFSRRVQVLVTRQPSAIATASLLRTAIMAWGLPEILKADNGKDYTAVHVNRIAADLDFTIDYCTPFTPEQKPHIERFFGTLTRDFFETLPGFVGHSVPDQQAMRSRKSMGDRFAKTKTTTFNLTAGELQIVIDEWVKDIYEQETHSGIKMPPFQKALSGRARRIKDERALDLLLAPAPDQNGLRKVQKKGVSVFNRWYISAELGGMIGEHVSVRIDPENEARIVIYSTDTKEFICLAEDPTMTGADMRDIALRARQTQTRELRTLRKQAKAARSVHNTDSIGADILRQASEDARKINTIRAAYIDVTPASVEREREAAAALDDPTPAPAPLTPEKDAAATARLNEMMKEVEIPKTKWPENPLQYPDFVAGPQGEIDFYTWAYGLRSKGLLNEELTKELEELENDFVFGFTIKELGLNTKDTHKKLGVTK